MNEIIIHHYPASPVSEKIRTGMGLKKLAWRSVEHNRLPDRPELFAMTGGYRRIPVMQIGADIYCDTQCILRELERRVPSPTFFPNKDAGLPFALSRWSDGPMFELAFRVAFAPVVDRLPPALVTDRTRLYLGAQGDLKKEAADLPHTLAQLRPQLGWLEACLVTGHHFMLGSEPGMPDLLAWYLVWFVRERYAAAREFLAEFPMLNAWAQRMQAIGHGTSTPMTPIEALAIAKAAEPATGEKTDAHDPQGLKPGMKVTIVPITHGGDQPIAGTVRAVDRDTIAVSREHADCGRVAVHFPRVGYRVTIC
ncbi:glutathione S-transferase [Sulfuriferula plumbiphila]|uniref:Glutathione S-transferase n=1 Tax=Sulfuriferula plumbiphila TaxID=171865 RepID=A0A512L3F1_9PROT|nr:glutathione S-transferase family protein [Sulfuriferula plumbiphila]BBP02716.1 glutathione S-transferase [Sulfuriferula plumbiphila]GEP29010.1 glutathione S-transferase [Sulfuriferula plumbiphila]